MHIKLWLETLTGRGHLEDTDSIRIDLREIWWEGVELIQLAMNREQWWALVNMLMNLQVPQKAGNFLVTISFPRRTLHYGVSYNRIRVEPLWNTSMEITLCKTRVPS
jgi:hypothetical protein